MQREAKDEELENRRRRTKRKTGRRGFKMSFRAVRVTFVDREYDNSSSVLKITYFLTNGPPLALLFCGINCFMINAL